MSLGLWLSRQHFTRVLASIGSLSSFKIFILHLAAFHVFYPRQQSSLGLATLQMGCVWSVWCILLGSLHNGYQFLRVPDGRTSLEFGTFSIGVSTRFCIYFWNKKMLIQSQAGIQQKDKNKGTGPFQTAAPNTGLSLHMAQGSEPCGDGWTLPCCNSSTGTLWWCSANGSSVVKHQGSWYFLERVLVCYIGWCYLWIINVLSNFFWCKHLTEERVVALTRNFFQRLREHNESLLWCWDWDLPGVGQIWPSQCGYGALV